MTTPVAEAVSAACLEILAFYCEDEPPELRPSEPAGEVNVARSRVVHLGVGGDWRGCLLLGFAPEQVAFLAERVLGGPPEPGMEEALEGVLLEIGNQVAARACCVIDERGLGRADLTPPSLLQADGPMTLAWNLASAPRLTLVRAGTELLELTVGLAPGPRAALGRG